MSLTNETVLRPRFKIDLDRDRQSVLRAFDTEKKNQDRFIITHTDDHIFIKIPKEKQHFWSPQLELEVIQLEEHRCTVHGLFGPKPAVWTFFMFLHFVVITLFLGCAIWAYTRPTLDVPFVVQLVLMGILMLTWVVLYFGGRIGKATGTDQLRALYDFMRETLKL